MFFVVQLKAVTGVFVFFLEISLKKNKQPHGNVNIILKRVGRNF